MKFLAISKKTEPKFLDFLLYVFLLLLFCLGDADAMAIEQDSSWEHDTLKAKEICKLARNTSVPTEDLTKKRSKKELENCNAIALYYGFESNPDYIKAKECALINNNFDVLAMIYANGKEVKVNFNVALHYACMISDAAPAEMTGRINHLNKLKKMKKSTEDFNICDDITSGYMMGVCASWAQIADKTIMTE